MATKFSPIRACIFDVDGTLIDSEDIYTEIYNRILHAHGKPDYPWTIKAYQQSRGIDGTKRILEWSQLPLTVDEWQEAQKPYRHLFKTCKILPGVETLLSTLSSLSSSSSSPNSKLRLAVASSASHTLFNIKTSHIPEIVAAFTDERVKVFGDDEEMKDKRKKPFPDCFLLALKRINEAISQDARVNGGEEVPPVKPEECLVFEDSVAGVDAGRRAGMRVIWIPHPELRRVCRGREMDVLMGRMEKEGEVLSFDYSWEEANGGREVVELLTLKGERILSEDGWAEMRTSLEDFPFVEYGFGSPSAPAP